VDNELRMILIKITLFIIICKKVIISANSLKSRHVLMKELESHQKECRKVGEELASLKRELDDMKGECNLDYIEVNVDDNDLSNLNDIISDVK